MDKASLTNRNRLAIALLVVAKLFGIAGLVVGGTNRTLGAILLGLDAVLIVAAIVVAIQAMKEREVADNGDKELLRQMIREGTLQQHLRDLEAEIAKGESSDKN